MSNSNVVRLEMPFEVARDALGSATIGMMNGIKLLRKFDSDDYSVGLGIEVAQRATKDLFEKASDGDEYTDWEDLYNYAREISVVIESLYRSLNGTGE